MSNIITFTNVFKIDMSEHFPQPASKHIPDWYKETQSYFSGVKKPIGDGTTTATIKRCIPVFDAITSGYIITTIVDVYVSVKEGKQWFEWPVLEPMGFHHVEQAMKHPKFNGQDIPKWISPWAISTPKNWSCLFVPPLHRENALFTALPGIVDTDSYKAPINFPFTMNDTKFEGLIEAGTPIVQVIPLYRGNWTSRIGDKKDLAESEDIFHKIRQKFFDNYKKRYWKKKDYKGLD